MIAVHKMCEGQKVCVGRKLWHEQPEGDQKMIWQQQLLEILIAIHLIWIYMYKIDHFWW